MIVRDTWAGDANRDRVINRDDYFAIDFGFAVRATRFASGDFNYDG